MSKRGGTSEVNGFISLHSDDKKTTRRKDENVSKRGSDETVRRKRETTKDAAKSTTPSRTRVSEGASTKDSSKTREESSRVGGVKEKSGTSEKTEIKLGVKKEAKHPLVQKRKPALEEKPSTSSRNNQKPRIDKIMKSKESASSPYIAATSGRPKIMQSISQPQLKKKPSPLQRESPYKSSLAQKPQPRTSLLASGESRKPSQLTEMPAKSKTLKITKTALTKSSKPAATEPVRKKKSSSSSSKSKVTVSKRREEKVTSILEEPVLESEQQLKPFGEIHRSNTFTKEGNAPDSLTSDLTASQSQEFGSLSSVDPVDMDGYNYDDDFEDYESDFEEYLESEESNSQTEQDETSSDTETLDEDEVGDGYRSKLTTHEEKSIDLENSPTKSILKHGTDAGHSSEISKDNKSDKEKPLTVEEERKLDSGSYDLASHADVRRKKQIQDIRAAMDKENSNLSNKLQSHRKMRSFTEDEGFVEVFNQDSPQMYQENVHSPTEGLINFATARKQQMKQKAKAKVQKRGTLLMEMIKLDVMSFQLLDIPSVPYEVYMKCYGRSNTLQIHTQTNEDAITEEVQTDEVETTCKWTQHPVRYSSPKSPDDLLFAFSQERLGVGGEKTVHENEEDWFPKLHVNSLQLHNFINNAGEMILSLLEEYERDRLEVSKATNKRDFGFSDSFTRLNVGKVDFLKGRPVSIVCFSESNSSHILTVHNPSTEPLTIQAESEGRCILCTWSVREPSCPLQTLVASNLATSICFHSYLVFAGLVDGVMCLWDLREQSIIHCRCFLKQPDWLLRSPTYISANLERDKRHLSPIMSIKILPESNSDDSAKTTTEQTPTQIVSLDEDGLLVVWTIVETRSSTNVDSGLAPWGRVRLVQSSHLRVLKAFPRSIERAIQCRCLTVDSVKPSNLYVGTNSGQVLHCLQTSARARPQFYTANLETNTSITCMEFSRCGHPLFMVGDTTGRVQIYRTMTERPLVDVSASAVSPGPPVKGLQWSSAQPGLFFVLDANSCIHVWDLCRSDMCPQMSVPFSGQTLTSICLTPHPASKMMAIASEAGTVDIYSLKAEFGTLPKKDSERLQDVFSRYITIL